MQIVHCPECEHDFLPQLSGKIECPECALHGAQYARLLHDLPCMFDQMSVGEVCEAAGLVDVWDAAVPQDFFDANREEIDRRGGFVIWTYPKGNMFGQPMFADQLFTRAAKNHDGEPCPFCHSPECNDDCGLEPCGEPTQYVNDEPTTMHPGKPEPAVFTDRAYRFNK